jgi:hypothetical protein
LPLEEHLYRGLISVPDNDGEGDRERSPARDLSHLEGTTMLNPQSSSRGSGAARRTRPGWQRSPNLAPARTPDLLSRVRRVPPTYLGLTGLVLVLVGLLTSASWLLVGLGAALMLTAGLTSMARPRTKVMYWRGRRIELTDEPSSGGRLGRWLRRR